jgi:hypothetical protein
MDQQAIDEINAANEKFIEEITESIIRFRDGVSALAEEIAKEFEQAKSRINGE